MLMEFNKCLSWCENIMIFPAYMKRINNATYKVNPKIITDYLFMYGKTKPCINGKNLYSYKQERDIIGMASISKLIRKYGFEEYTDYVVENGDYLLSPKAYYTLVFSSDDLNIIDQFNKVFMYEHMYNKYLLMKNQ